MSSDNAITDVILRQEVDNKYQYSALRNAGAIRLLRVDVGGETPSYSLIETDIRSAPPYVAISYVWGDPTTKYHIELPSGTVGVTESLRFALKDVVRVLRNSEDVPGGSNIWTGDIIHLWADAICINQQDIQEKNIQVPMMTHIYANAILVVTYMGPEADNSDQAITFLEELQGFFQKGQDSDTDRYPFAGDYDLSDFGLPPSHDPRWNALRQLYRRSWSERVWIAQEFIVNKNMILVCGCQIVRYWADIRDIVEYVFLRGLPKECFSNSMFYESSALNGITRLHVLRSLYQRRAATITLSMLLLHCHCMRSSDPRDKVYALLSLAVDRDALGIRADYSPTITVRYVYTAVTVRTIEYAKTLDVLSSVCMRDERHSGSLPSWITDWSLDPLPWQADVLTCIGNCQRNDMDASGKTLAHVSYNTQQTELTTLGICVDELVFASDKTDRSDTALQWGQHLSCVLDTVLRTGNHIYKTISGSKQAFRRATTYDFDHDYEVFTSIDETELDAWLKYTSLG